MQTKMTWRRGQLDFLLQSIEGLLEQRRNQGFKTPFGSFLFLPLTDDGWADSDGSTEVDG
jgi:hypothetical protein